MIKSCGIQKSLEYNCAMDLLLNNKVAFVAASSQGLGYAVAKELLQEGCHVIISGRKINNLEYASQTLSDFGKGKILALAGDVSDEKDCNRMIKASLDEFKTIDILITNSGGPPSGSFDQFSLDDWESAYHLLLGSTLALIKGFLPQMKAQKWGRIVAITSQAVKQPVDGLILSNSVRAAVSGLIKSLSNELGVYNITVNNLLPGSTETGRLKNLLKVNPSFKDSIKNIPLGRFGKPHEFAAAVAFFVSERASYITGTSLAIDGGSIKNIL